VDFFRRQNWDIVGKSPYWFTISALIIVTGLVMMFTKGLNLGIDFTGGSLFTFSFQSDIVGPGQDAATTIAKVRAALRPAGLEGSSILVAGTREVLIRTHALTDETRREHERILQDVLANTLGSIGGTVKLESTDFVGPVVGADLKRSALWALFLGSILIIIYITIRYELRFAIAGWVALLHDVLVLVGAMAILQVPLNSPFVAVILTVLGYSINDSVIIFDRIRENRRLHRGADFANTVNASLLQTMARSINTMVTTLFPLIALFLLGGPSISGFALALIIGITSGGYSSIFIAAPLVVIWHRRARQRAQLAAVTPAAQRRPQPARPAPAAQPTPEVEPTATTPAPVSSAVAAMQRAQEAAQEEKRAQRRARRKLKQSQKKASKKSKRRKKRH